MLSACKLLHNLTASKLLFLQSNDPIEQLHVLRNYRLACDIGRGGVLLAVARSEFLERFDFSGQYCRLLMFLGLPYQYIQAPQYQQMLAFEKQVWAKSDYLMNSQVCQYCEYLTAKIGSQHEKGVVIYADERFARNIYQQQIVNREIEVGEIGVEREIGRFMV